MPARNPSFFAAASALALLAVWWFGTADTLAYPTPQIVSKSWQLDFTFEPPRPISVTRPDGSIEWYWYLTYKVTNNTGDDRLFIPDITIATDEGDIVNANRSIPTAAFDAVQKSTGNPLLESPMQVIGKLLQGPDHARESVAVWRDYGKDVGEVRVFVQGLSGETVEIQTPDPADASRTVKVLLSKTLMATYQLPGLAASPQDQPVVAKGQKWIMR